MNKEDILRQAQAENNGRDVADLDAQKRGTYFAYLVGICLMILIDIVEGIVLHRINYGANLAIFVMAAVAFWTKYRTLKKKHELFVTVIYAVGALVWGLLWVLQLCGVVK